MAYRRLRIAPALPIVALAGTLACAAAPRAQPVTEAEARPAEPLYVPGQPLAEVDTKEASTDAGMVPISDADRVIASLRPRFAECYRYGLRSDPTMAGRVVLTARIDPDGSPRTVERKSGDGLSTAVVDCLALRVRSAHFSAPGGGGATLQIPITFIARK